MREIKFRAWDKERKIMGQALMLSKTDGSIAEVQFYGDKDWIVQPVIMQFTGLKDKNGKEIYEGDIVEHTQPEGGLLPPSEPKLCVIRFDEGAFSPFIIGDKYEGKVYLRKELLEVIGNIYENPELLNK